MGGISAIFFVDLKGRILIQRVYKGYDCFDLVDRFNQKVIELDENLIPIIQDKDVTFFHRRVNNLIIVAASHENINTTMVFTFIDTLQNTLKQYFKELEEESIRDNFVVIYELLDEMIDNGYPQTTDYKILSEFITTESHQLIKKETKDLSSTITNAVSWRPEGIKYQKNEIFLDVFEKLNMLVGVNGQVIKSEVLGSINARCFLSGMPELKLGLNDKALYELQGKSSTETKTVELNDIKFHQCVRLSKFEHERVISFIPPDQEFELISYRLDMDVKPLFSVDIAHDIRATKMDYIVKIRSNFKSNCSAQNVNVNIPVPCDVQNPVFRPSSGVKYFADKDCVQWSIKNFIGTKEFIMTSTFTLPTVESPERYNFKKIPVQIEFEIPYFTVSGIQVKYLKIVDSSNYQGNPWVRYVTMNGDYQIRVY